MASLLSSQECSPAEDLHPSQDESTQGARRASQARRSGEWFLASWNVRTLLDVDGPIETASHGCGVVVVDERKIDQVVAELGRYKVDVAGLQETKWFGDGVYEVAESMVIAAGRPVPGAGAVMQRGEGVAVVLSGAAVEAWRSGGCRWKAWSSRLVSVTMKVGGGCTDVLHVVSCYAPTFAASREEKENFYSKLQEVLSCIPSQECFVLLGDFNARVGSRSGDDKEWWDERGPHGFGVLNEAGRELLSFCSLNGATVCNTWFQKRAIHKQTWQHPKSKQWHCIDYVIMRRAHSWRCLDVVVKRGAVCNTDHHLLLMRLKLGRKFSRRGAKERLVKRFDVSKLLGACQDERGRELVKGKFVSGVCEELKKSWVESGSAQVKWDTLKSAMSEVGKRVLGQAKRREADWFRENEDVLKPLFEERSRRYTQWLSSGKERDRKKFAKVRRDARKAMREVKNKWFQRKAVEASAGKNGGKVVWKCIRDIQRSRRGMVPVRVTTVRDEHGNSCVTPDAQSQRWKRHFTKVLNIESVFSDSEVECVKQRPVREEMAEPPCEEELLEAVRRMKSGKAAGESGILPEMMRAMCCDEEFVGKLLQLIGDVWAECRVPADWRDAVLIPIPKKGDLSECDNWRGISLLDVVGKVVARIIQGRLQVLAEEVLPESQCGFRSGRGCMDMVFTVRQLVEKSWEHKEKVFFTFVDLKKAYDSVPRQALWKVLRKLGVPGVLVNLIESFHQDMQAKIRLKGKLMDPIDVRNGLRQGCCMAPVLFNLFMNAVVERWEVRKREAGSVGGVRLLYKYDGKLFRRYTRDAREGELSECQFADDSSLLSSSRTGAECTIRSYQEVASRFGLTVSRTKTKFMVTGRLAKDSDRESIDVDGGQIECVEWFPYLGSLIADSGRMDVDVERRISQASKAFGALRKAVFLDKNLTMVTKRKVFNACVLSVLLYGSECWTPLRKHISKLSSFYHRCIRAIMGISSGMSGLHRLK